jgi:3-oxoacyl-[acyl-carrier-protein] synthase II
MADVVVTGIGLITALGDRPHSWKQLLAGASGITRQQPFPELPPRPLGLVQPPQLSSLTQLVAIAVQEAIQDADLAAANPAETTGLVIGSSRGHQSQWEAIAQGEMELENWLERLPCNASTQVVRLLAAQQIGVTGPVYAPMNACATGLWAVAQGYDLVRRGECDRVLAGAVESPITRLSLTGFAQMGALASQGAYPFDQHRDGLVLGEGGALLVLERRELAEARGAQIYGRVLGWGMTNDAYHLTAPCGDRRAALTAIQQCLSRSGLAPSEINYIHAHGTSTQLNDANEAELIGQIFGPRVWVSSSKGATGHTLGGSGGIAAAVSVMALRSQLVPPNVGLHHPAFDLNLVRQVQPAALQQVLALSFGFGGQNCAVAFGQ